MNSSFEIKVILFDLGRVLMHIDFDAFPNGLGLITREWRRQYEEPTKKIVRLYEEGKISTSEFLDTLYLIYDCRFSRDLILESFNGIIVADNEEIIPFVNEVRKQYRIAILSNTCACHWEKVERVSSAIKQFPRENIFTSFGLGAMKPERKIYEEVCSALNVLPEEVIFIDDLKENIDGALRVGMEGIIFTNTAQLKSAFYDLLNSQNT